MAREINVIWQGSESVFDLSKIDRSKLYGKRRRLVLDDEGEICEKAELSEDGATIIKSGMTAQAYFDEDGEWVENSRLVGLDPDDNLVELVPSTLGRGQQLELSTPEALSQNVMIAVYHLSEKTLDSALRAALDKGDIFKFAFNYRGDYAAETAFLLSNNEGVFALITHDASPRWSQLEKTAATSFDDSSEIDDDLDFEMF